MIENLFSSIVVSFYTQANSDWKMVKSEQWFQPAPYYDGLQNTTVLVDEKNRVHYDTKSSIFFEFEYERNSTMLVNSWLIPFIVLMFVSNFVFLIVDSGKISVNHLNALNYHTRPAWFPDHHGAVNHDSYKYGQYLASKCVQ